MSGILAIFPYKLLQIEEGYIIMVEENPVKELFERVVPTNEFTKHIAQHEMTVYKDEGFYRHIRFGRPKSSIYYFELTTWPGYLAVTGDCGDFLFTRTTDMFTFFRRNIGSELSINHGYWQEKCVAGETKKFDIDTFHKNVIGEAKQQFDIDDDAELTEELKDDLYNLLHAEDEFEAVSAYRDYSGMVDMCDFWESSCDKYTYQFEQCLWNIVYGIYLYDKSKEVQS